MARKEKNELRGSGGKALPLFYTAALIAAALAIMIVSALIVPRFGPQRGGEVPGMPPDLEDYLLVKTVLSFINLALVIYLLYVHVKDYLRLKTSFTLGLIAFLFSFLLYALSTLPFLHFLLGEESRAAFISFVPVLFSAVGLVIFAKLSNQ